QTNGRNVLVAAIPLGVLKITLPNCVRTLIFSKLGVMRLASAMPDLSNSHFNQVRTNCLICWMPKAFLLALHRMREACGWKDSSRILKCVTDSPASVLRTWWEYPNRTRRYICWRAIVSVSTLRGRLGLKILRTA